MNSLPLQTYVPASAPAPSTTTPWRRCVAHCAGALRRALPALCALVVLANPAAAEEGVTADAIVISRVIALNGPAGAKGREQEEALQAYFASVNMAGGVHGRKILLRTTDLDLRAESALAKIYAEQRPFAFFLFGGTAGSTVAMGFASERQIPFVAPNSGAVVFHQPPKRSVFNVRARYQDEVIAAVKHFATVNQRKLAIVYVDDAFGRDAAEGYREGRQSVPGVVSVYEGAFAPDGSDLGTHMKELARTSPDAVIAVGASKRIADLIKMARGAGVPTTFMTLSNNASAGFADELGEHARGVIVGQVTPPGTGSSRLGRELHQMMSRPPEAVISYASMEAYASAKVLVEGLRRAGPNLSREAFVKALETMRRTDFGGLEIGYTPSSRSGSNFVELSILTRDGKYRR